jgi:hypothetical protein
MGQTKKLYEQMTLQDWIMEHYNNTCDSDYQYQEYQEKQNKQFNDQMEDYFKNHLNYEN